MIHELLTLIRLFVRLSLTAFGGPAAHIAMMDDEVVGRLANRVLISPQTTFRPALDGGSRHTKPAINVQGPRQN